MIKNKSDYKKYIYADRDAMGIPSHYVRPKLFGHTIWKFTILLRKWEYHLNCKHKLRAFFYKYIYLKKCQQNASLIMPNSFCEGLSIAHLGCIFVAKKAKIGRNCYIHQGVTIGVKDGEHTAPQIGDNVNIGAGAILIGNIKVANNVTIGANALVCKSIDIPNSVWGVPAKLLKVYENKK